MTNEEAKKIIFNQWQAFLEDNIDYAGISEAYKMAMKALEPKPMEKFEDVKTHIQRLAGDYKCWDNRLTWEEALELNRMLEAQPCEDCISRQAVDDAIYDYSRSCDVNYEQIMEFIDKLPSVTPRRDLAETSQDCISREAVIRLVEQYPNIIGNRCSGLISDIKHLPSVHPKYTDEEIDKAQAVEQAYVDKMVELAVEESRREWLNSFDTNSATKCFEAVNLLKQRLEGEE